MPPSSEKVKSFVGDSRGAIFKDKSLALLMVFFKLVQQHLASTTKIDDSTVRISEEDMEIPFVDFLTKMRLPPKINLIILYAIAMLDYDQDNIETCRDLLKTKEGIDRLALYITSIGRFYECLLLLCI
ncbi:unnamed protein product [Arabis nemorensis]|uniref:Uncharacterized protein n=1 Tax=Arabis nemorensis TaxID=586526 RepID=A0A565CTB4_9BRAS|nr:unnamed protein product [Arabis nemorensis]